VTGAGIMLGSQVPPFPILLLALLSAVMLLAQLIVIGLLVAWDRWHAGAIGGLVIVQAVMMWRFLAAPVERALWLSALGVPFYVSGMMISAFAVRTTPIVEAVR